jgi:hypothetical protein
MTFLGRLLTLGAVLALAGCSNARKDAERTLRQIGAQSLRLDAGTLYKDLFAAPSGQYFLLSPDKRPPSFQRFAPLQVRAYTDGFALSLRDKPDVEEGLYIVPAGMDREPRLAPSARFERIDAGVYWYRFTR